MAFGLPVHTSVEGLCNKLNTLLDTDIKTQDIIKLYKLGKTDRSPVKVEFISKLQK